MDPRHTSRRQYRQFGLTAVVAAVFAGAVWAQPSPQPSHAPTDAQAPRSPVAEEAPPATVATPPTQTASPPVDAKDVAPAAAPKAQVTEKLAATVVRRARYEIAVLQALDKVTAETLRFEAAVGRPVRWKGLVFTVRACERSAPDEPIEDAAAYLSIESQPRPQPGRPSPPPRQAFKGWMYAASPGLNPLQHATYDAWVISCRTNAPPPPPVRPVVAKPAPKPAVAVETAPPVPPVAAPSPPTP